MPMIDAVHPSILYRIIVRYTTLRLFRQVITSASMPTCPVLPSVLKGNSNPIQPLLSYEVYQTNILTDFKLYYSALTSVAKNVVAKSLSVKEASTVNKVIDSSSERSEKLRPSGFKCSPKAQNSTDGLWKFLATNIFVTFS